MQRPSGPLLTHVDELPPLLVDPDLPVAPTMSQVRQGHRLGYVDLRPRGPQDFEAVVPLPGGPYFVEEVDTGKEFFGVAPRQALAAIIDAGRSPLTIAEGVALVLAHPGLLRTRNCFQMLGSRAGDKRIPSLWVTREGRPRLGWCWEGAPHSWLGAASCARRVPT